MKCIILAAGQGKRIDQVTKNKPKCLIKINKETLLERQIKYRTNSISSCFKNKQSTSNN